MENKKRTIVCGLRSGSNGKIAKALNCSLSMVSLSLNGHKDTDMAKRIRYVAETQYGGKVVEI